MKHFTLIFLLSLLLNSFSYGQADSINVRNYLKFSEKLVFEGAHWKSTLKDDKNFDSFVMAFTKNSFNGLEGTISGITLNKDTVDFWKVYEFINYHTGEIHFIQTSNFGSVVSLSQYTDSTTRISNFELTYANGLKEKHRDKHVILDSETIVTDSDLFDENTKKWITQPRLIWKRIKA